MKQTISVVVIAKNEAKMIRQCLHTVKRADELVLIDNGSTDDTAKIAESMGAKVVGLKHTSFSRLREEGMKRSSSDWIFYLDADERVTPLLWKEIGVQLETCNCQALSLHRVNVFYGKLMQHGGWANEQVVRVFQRAALKGWQGQVHESPKYDGELIRLNSPLIHLSHRSVQDGLVKTQVWTKMEAELIYQANHPPVTLFTFVRKGCMEFFRRLIMMKGYKDGMPGVVEAVTQAVNRVLVYLQVWELQQDPSLEKIYQQEEEKIKKKWQDEGK